MRLRRLSMRMGLWRLLLFLGGLPLLLTQNPLCLT